MSNLKIKTDVRDILLGKFTMTLQTISGYLMEARGDMKSNTSYYAEGVYNRIEQIHNELYSDIEKLAKEIEIED
jgi:hypothetical protein